MACGCAVISTYHAGIPEAIEPDENGWLIAKKDQVALVKTLDRAVNDASARNLLASNAQAKARKMFGRNHMQKLLSELLHEVEI